MKVMIAEPIPWANKGEVAIFKGMMKSFEILGAVQVSLFSHYPQQDQAGYRESADVIEIAENKSYSAFNALCCMKLLLIALLNKTIKWSTDWMQDSGELKRWKAILGADVVIIGHDNCRIEMSFEALCVVSASKIIGKKVVFYAGSFGPFSNRFRRMLAKFAFNQADLITCREPISYQNLLDLKLHKKFYLTADLAFLLEPSDVSFSKVLGADFPVDRPIVGINMNRLITRYCSLVTENSDDKYDKFISIMTKLIDRMVEVYCCYVILIPHVYGYGEDNDDRIVLRDLWSKLSRKNNVSMIETELPVEDIKGLISKMDFFIGARTHSLIAALSTSVPSIALTSSNRQHNKTNGILSYLFDGTDLLYNVSDLSEESLIKKVDWAWGNRDNIRTILKDRSSWIAQKASLNGVLLKEVIESNKADHVR